MRTAARVMSTTPSTAMAGLTFISMVISLTSAGMAARATCGSTMRRKRRLARMPTDMAASIWSLGKASRAPRQISQLKADVLSVSVIMPAGTGSSDTPISGSEKYSSSPSVTAGAARIRLT